MTVFHCSPLVYLELWMDLLPRYDFVTTPSGCLEKFIENKKAVKLTGEILVLHNFNFHLRAQILPLATVIVSCSPWSSSLIGESLTRLGSVPPWYVMVLPASEHALHGKSGWLKSQCKPQTCPHWRWWPLHFRAPYALPISSYWI